MHDRRVSGHFNNASDYTGVWMYMMIIGGKIYQRVRVEFTVLSVPKPEHPGATSN
jgi:hypothetical protein